MRLAGALATAVLLAFALGPAGCKPSSLTPFGIGTQDYGAGPENVNGLWVGTTGTGGEVKFQVGSDTVSNSLFSHVGTDCTLKFTDKATTALIVNGEFTIELPLDQGSFFATGRFTSSTTCSGTYLFQALPAGKCPTSAAGTFVAEKAF